MDVALTNHTSVVRSQKTVLLIVSLVISKYTVLKINQLYVLIILVLLMKLFANNKLSNTKKIK